MARKLSPTSLAQRGARPYPTAPADLPRAPGVYQFEAEGGPRSTSARAWICAAARGYFYGGGPSCERTAEMLALARRGVARDGQRPRGASRGGAADRRRTAALQPRSGTERAAGTWRSIGAIHSHDRGSYGLHVARALDFGPYRGRATPERVARLIERAFGLRSCCGRVLPDPAGSPCLAHEIDPARRHASAR